MYVHIYIHLYTNNNTNCMRGVALLNVTSFYSPTMPTYYLRQETHTSNKHNRLRGSFSFIPKPYKIMSSQCYKYSLVASQSSYETLVKRKYLITGKYKVHRQLGPIFYWKPNQFCMYLKYTNVCKVRTIVRICEYIFMITSRLYNLNLKCINFYLL